MDNIWSRQQGLPFRWRVVVPTTKPKLPIGKTLGQPDQQVVVQSLIDTPLEYCDTRAILRRNVGLRPGGAPIFVIAAVRQRYAAATPSDTAISRSTLLSTRHSGPLTSLFVARRPSLGVT